jgi:hypothetical protein
MPDVLPPPADKWIVQSELIRIKLILDNPQNIIFAGERSKNMEFLAELGITPEGCFTYLRQMSYKNYLSGPADDRDTDDKACIWEFGTIIEGTNVYIKIKHLTDEGLLILSFHKAEKPFVFRF